MDDDIDTSNEWLLGDEVETQPNLMFDGDDLSWLDVDIASGAAQPTINTRSQAKKATTPAPIGLHHIHLLHLGLSLKQKLWQW
jgi:hypothetical protein